MAYDEGAAQRVRELLEDEPGLTEKKMFGGIAFLLNGNMACGVTKDELMVRVGPEGHAAAVSQPHVRPFDLTGRPMAGWIVVGPAGYESDQALQNWVRQGVAFARSLPPK
ncbi:MAG: TfoX/Sxy family protein [Chloroflexi bacterium]|nr:TfoX/Sxy family protein [Chloroflexota bacterium]MCI0577967.1 TfoX/Sxy family protein [Chloroflexota bacterium]MCI0649277.1 TfoX/Sxy family protein [Chloroflexota bacterium]MCI0729470.1 TfoX/Sxy family protein [Chloroflexota bacterium]